MTNLSTGGHCHVICILDRNVIINPPSRQSYPPLNIRNVSQNVSSHSK